MFSRFSFISLLAVPAVLSLCMLSVLSAPVDVELTRRQVGDLQCNIDRLSTVANLAKTTTDVNDLASAGSADSSVTSATTAALSGLNSAKSGIETIAQALITGSTAPASARDQVGQGLTAAQTALSGISSTDTAVTSALSKAQGDLTKTLSAGEGVVANCN